MLDTLAIASKQKRRDKRGIRCVLNSSTQRGYKVLEKYCVVVKNGDIVNLAIGIE